MSYRFQPGKFTSHRTGRTYEYPAKDESARRAAKRQMEHDDQSLASAQATRLQNAPPDTRTARERTHAEATHRAQSTTTLSSALDGRLRDLRRDLGGAMSEASRNQIRRRIAQTEISLEA